MGDELQHLREENEHLRAELRRLKGAAKLDEASMTMLQASESRYRDLFENAIDPIFIVDKHFRYVDVNRRATEAFGYSRDEFLSMSIFDLIPPDQVPRSEEELQKLQDRGSYEHFEGKMRTKDGRWIDIEVSSSAILDEDGTVIGSRDIVRDITERKRMETTLQRSLQEKEMLLREMNHRIKNNLQVIMSLLSLQSMQVEDARTAELLKESENRVRSMSMIHEKLYRSDDFTHIHFSDYLDSLTHELFDSFNIASGISLKLDVPKTSLDVDLVIPCGIIVNELVSNALKYAFPRGTGTIHVGFRKHDDGTCTLSVQDDGVGLPGGFDPMSRELRSMGLRLVRSSAEKLDAEMSVSSDSGTTFKFTFREAAPELASAKHRT